MRTLNWRFTFTMENANKIDLLSLLSTSLMETNFMVQLSLDEDSIQELVNSEKFCAIVKYMMENNDYSCKMTLLLCEDFLNHLATKTISIDWLNYIYQYTLNKAFPLAVTIQLFQEFDKSCIFYLKLLSVVSEYQKHSSDNTWLSLYPFEFLTIEEESNLENSEEYKNFLLALKNDYIYEMMKLNQELMGYNTLDHICGVHYIALYIGRQLKALGLPVDLGRVSGAAAGHDIGKYGCRVAELNRVPYLHYYYSDIWFKKHDITYIRHIAVNHSTWDLELENLPIESLILIYSDFRVKNKNVNGINLMHIFNLKESFDVILNKLDNLNDKKTKRYQKVYSKLKDFEDYIRFIGVETELLETPKLSPSNINLKNYNYSLLQEQQIVDNIKYLSINHNINLMYRLRDEASLNSILELARSENDWKNLREYLYILEEYSTYLTQKQKLITIKFLYEQLVNPEDDIRRHCGELIGTLIGFFDEEYRKDVPDDENLLSPEITSDSLLDEYIEHFIKPDHKIIAKHRSWIGYSLSIMLSSLFYHCPHKKREDFTRIILNHFKNENYNNEAMQFYILEAANCIPISENDDYLSFLCEFIAGMLNHTNQAIRLSAYEVALSLLPSLNKNNFYVKIFIEKLKIDIEIPSSLTIENYLKTKLAVLLNVNCEFSYNPENCLNDVGKISDIFLNNLKTATDWVIKKNQISLLLDYAIKNPDADIFYTAMHFCNLLKVSAVESVRNSAGEALLQIIPFLSLEQRNDVAIELMRALEIEGFHFTKYIPEYLGQIILFLKPKELDEIIEDFYDKVKSSSPQLVSLLINTIGITLEFYADYKNNFVETDERYNSRRIKLLGILLNGLVNYDSQVKQVAFSVIGKNIFMSNKMSLEYKNIIFTLIAKKMLTLLMDSTEEQLLFLTNSAVLNNIYRFISEYMFLFKKINISSPQKVAFFPGAFDPFSSSHKEITRRMRDMGFEVYLQVDEFSWSKQVHPNLIRRNIINMSIADELNIYLYPEDYPTNIANPLDLSVLRSNFPNSDVHIVVGSDVIENASSYKTEKSINSIHTFSHIIFARRNELGITQVNETFNLAIKKVEGNIVILSLQPQFEDISSTQIRDYIDDNRDISNLVDPLAQKYIYKNGLYKREPQYKTLIQTTSIKIEIIEEYDDALINKLASCVEFDKNYILEQFKQLWTKPNCRFLIVRDLKQNGRILGFTIFHWIRSYTLFDELNNHLVCEYIRENAVGRIILIDGLFLTDKTETDNISQIILTETLAFCIARDYDYAIYRNCLKEYPNNINELLQLHGFEVCNSNANETNPVYVVNMDHPCVISMDLEAFIKDPFISNHVQRVIEKNRKKLQSALTGLYPGHLIMAFNRQMINETVTRKICEENGVPLIQSNPRVLGNYMCVPFGNILKRNIIPNTVTKALHTEKFFNPDLKTYNINAYPYYLDLENQVKMIHSFNRPVILVDDLLHKGYRMKALDPLLKKEKIRVQKIITGILSGRGKELMDMQNREVDAAYFIPKLRVWFNESALYPFIGGDILWRGIHPQNNLVPSINLIFPYSSATFIKGTTKAALYNLSQACIENSIEIITALEKEYEKFNERNLTLNHLSEVFISPKCPDQGKDMFYDLNLPPSHYLENDLELLKRLEIIIK